MRVDKGGFALMTAIQAFLVSQTPRYFPAFLGFWCYALCAFLLMLLFVTIKPAAADLQEYLSQFHPYITIQEKYDDNIYLTRDNVQSDFITTITPGLRYVARGQNYKFDLGFEMGLNYYTTDSSNNYINYSGRLNSHYILGPRWTFTLDDNVIRSRNNLQSYTVVTPTGDQNFTSSNTGQILYFRNVFQPSVKYKFGRENSLTLNYLNMVYREDEGNANNSMENSVTPRLLYWFDIRNGIALDYTLNKGDFDSQTQPNWLQNKLVGRYLYRFNPRTDVFGEYSYLTMDFESPGIDYAVHSQSAGINHSFGPNLRGTAQLGWFRQIVDTGPALSGPIYNFSITQQGQRTSYTLAFEGGYQEQYFTSDNLGISFYNRIRGTINHRFQQKVNLGLAVNFGREDYQNPDRIDYVYSVTGNLSYQLFRWLTASLEAGNYGRDSDLESNTYRNNRVMLIIKAEY